jgi:Na+-translocating ferredoxin:NAD+ oxidoreductase subunit B
MEQDVYDQLADIFNMIGYGSHKSSEFTALLKALFNEKEAKLAVNLSPLAPEHPSKVAQRIGEDPAAVAALLNEMADKGLIYSSLRNGENWYKIIQLVPGIFELQFMKGETTPRSKELAKLFDAYFHARTGEEIQLTAKEGGGPHFSRVLPIEETISPGTNVFPFEQARKYVEEASAITVSTCYCRHEQRLLERGCGYPDEVCLQLGPFAEFVRDRGFGREIGKTEALEILKKSADAGLIHTSSNTQERIDFICNCCTCCCGILRGVSHFNAPVRSISSNYEATVDPQACTGCGECVGRCQMTAVVLAQDCAQVNRDRCIGCGVCVYHCPAGAMTLVPRSDFVEPPRSFKDLIALQAAAKTQNA